MFVCLLRVLPPIPTEKHASAIQTFSFRADQLKIWRTSFFFIKRWMCEFKEGGTSQEKNKIRFSRFKNKKGRPLAKEERKKKKKWGEFE